MVGVKPRFSCNSPFNTLETLFKTSKNVFKQVQLYTVLKRGLRMNQL